VLVGSMSDLEDLRQVRLTDGDAMAQSLGITFCGEASSKTGDNWEEAFQELFQQIVAEIEADELFTDAALSDEGSTTCGRPRSSEREQEQEGGGCSIM